MNKSSDITERVIERLSFNADGLIPAIAQAAETGEVLMLAWMNADAVRETLQTGRVCYWSRSRQALWRKGETSGHVQQLVEFSFDCDEDTILLRVDQTGPACHTNRRSCFYNAVQGNQIVIAAEPITGS